MTDSLFRRTLVAGDSAAGGPAPLTLVHGFTQNSECWGRFAEQVAHAGQAIRAADAPGHGQSNCDDDDLHAAGNRLVSNEASHWVGYSMGGRMLLRAALGPHAHTMRSLVLIGATGGIEDDTERQARRDRDNTLADRIEQIGTPAFIDEWLATPLFAGLGDLACREQRLTNRAAGMASSLRNCGTGTQLPLWDQLHMIDVPTLIIAGTNDRKFTELGHRLVDAIGDNAQFTAVTGGHAVHLENPDETAAAIRRWAS